MYKCRGEKTVKKIGTHKMFWLYNKFMITHDEWLFQTLNLTEWEDVKVIKIIPRRQTNVELFVSLVINITTSWNFKMYLQKICNFMLFIIFFSRNTTPPPPSPRASGILLKEKCCFSILFHANYYNVIHTFQHIWKVKFGLSVWALTF